MRCTDCKSWITRRITAYEDGTELPGYAAPEGRGHCNVLGIETAAEFGCIQFAQGDHVEIVRKPGAPRQHWIMVPCPDSNGTGLIGEAICKRCGGTGKVRLYDDGYLGEEQTRMHPTEVLLNKKKAREDAIAAAQAQLRAAEAMEDVPLPAADPPPIRTPTSDGMMTQQGGF